MDEESKIGLIVGCTIGGLILIVFILVLLLLLCCRSEKENDKQKYDDDADSQHSHGDYSRKKQAYVPPGIWTTKPSMVGDPQFKPVPAYIPAEDTIDERRQHIPPARDVAVWTSASLAAQRDPGTTRDEMVRQIDMPNETVKTTQGATPLQSAPEVEEQIRHSHAATARIFSRYSDDGKPAKKDEPARVSRASTSSSSSQFVAKMYCDYSQPKDFLPPSDERESSLARAYRDADTTNSAAGSPSTFIAKAVVRENAYSVPQDAVRMVKSDMNLAPTGFSLVRSASNAEQRRTTTLQREPKVKKTSELGRETAAGAVYPHHNYGRGVFMRSPSDAQDYAHLRYESIQPVKKDKKDKHKKGKKQARSSETQSSVPSTGSVNVHDSKQISPAISPMSEPPSEDLVARVYSRPPSQSSEKSKSLQRYSAPDDPEAIYTSPDVVRQSKKLSANRNESLSADEKPLSSDSRTRSKSLRSVTSVGHADKTFVGEAFEFLDDFDDISQDEFVEQL